MIVMVEERDVCFSERKRGRDYFGLVSFGIFLLVVGVVFMANPNIPADFQLWVEQMSYAQDFVRPPEGLMTSAILFFGLIGVLDFFQASLRFWFDRSKRRMLVDILSGIALVLLAFLIYLYSNHSIEWQMVIAIEVVAAGLLVMLYSIIRYIYLK